ncbi:MAG TPA: hypothetical protein ENI87_07680 [bacterium]|nr:hypothetical protein [bacterium]
MHHRSFRFTLISPLFATALLGQQHLVVPSAYATNDAISFNWIAGASRDVRQQTLIDASRLAPMLGRDITAIEFRRTAANEVYQGGSANMTVTLSIAPHTPLACSSSFAANIGTNPVQVFNGTVTFPSSPAIAAGPGAAVSWSTQNVVRVPFATPFSYTGGTLCVDIVGLAIPGQEANWWMADAEFEDLPGTVTDVGAGCGAYGGVQSRWAHAARRSLVPGGYAHMFAYGTPYGLAIAAIGDRSPVGMPMSAVGFQSPAGCNLFLSNVYYLEPHVFVPDPEPALVDRGGRADVEIKIPALPASLGFQATTQWIDWSQMASSNAIEWTVAAAIPSLGMALVEGAAQEATGNVTAHLAHVLRFEYQ